MWCGSESVSSGAIFITPRLRRNLQKFGPAGEAWLAGLQPLIERIADEWSVVIGDMFDGDASISWVAPATLADGTPAVVKIGMPHRESTSSQFSKRPSWKSRMRCGRRRRRVGTSSSVRN